MKGFQGRKGKNSPIKVPQKVVVQEGGGAPKFSISAKAPQILFGKGVKRDGIDDEKKSSNPTGKVGEQHDRESSLRTRGGATGVLFEERRTF